jgi:4-amino-4-deoxy-L-arabinose transferase-like glycosyltransferase
VLALFGWCLLLRAPTFLRSVLDWDETLYFIVADQWLQGHLPYVGVWDRKPVGIFAALAAGFAALGSNIFALRMLAVLATFASSVLLYLIGARLLGSRRGGAVVAISYSIFSLMPGGLATNTEIFFVPADLAGLLVLIDLWSRPRSGARRAAMLGLAGLAFGIAFQFKFVAAAESALFVLAYFVAGRFRPLGGAPAARLSALPTLGAGFLAPSALAGAYFAAHGAWSEYVHANFGANLRLFETHERSSQLWARIAADLAAGAGTWLWWVLPILLVAALSAILPPPAGAEERSPRGLAYFLGAWSVAALVGISATLRFYTHSFVALIPVCCLLFGLAVARLGLLEGSRMRLGAAVALPCALAIMRISDSAYVPWLRDFENGNANMYERAAAHLRSRLRPGETVFVVNDQPVLYMLTRVTPPTRYVFPKHLFDDFGAAYAGIDRGAEIRRVMNGRPAYITIQDGDGVIERDMRATIAPEYQEEIRFDSLVLYRWCGGPCGSRGP